ncbi:hypothetical protein NG825_14390 [Xanthomonas sacchari]|nr:hypothetical protein NG825_14390 [Xanthomonas sacchari]
MQQGADGEDLGGAALAAQVVDQVSDLVAQRVPLRLRQRRRPGLQPRGDSALQAACGFGRGAD